MENVGCGEGSVVANCWLQAFVTAALTRSLSAALDAFRCCSVIERATQQLEQKLFRLQLVAEANRLQQSINWRLISTVHVLWAHRMSQCPFGPLHLIRVFFYQGLSKGRELWCPIIVATVTDTLSACWSLSLLKAAALWTWTAVVTGSQSNRMRGSKWYLEPQHRVKSRFNPKLFQLIPQQDCKDEGALVRGISISLWKSGE